MTVDFIQRKRSKREAKKVRAQTRVDAEGKRIRTKRGVKQKLRGMCSQAPPVPPSLKEEDERVEAVQLSAEKLSTVAVDCKTFCQLGEPTQICKENCPVHM